MKIMEKFNEKYRMIMESFEQPIETNPDEIFTIVDDLGDGLIVYDVGDSEQEYQAVLDFIARDFGPTARPWAIVNREYFLSYPQKQIVFKNGKLYAFGSKGKFFDRQNKPIEF